MILIQMPMFKIIAIILLSFVGLIGFVFSNEILIMPWNDLDLPKMENPRIVVKKEVRTLEVFDGEKIIRTYKIALGSAPKGDKEIEGDGKTPEGEFYIFTKNSGSKFYLSIGVSYPGIDDAKRGLEQKLITQDEHDKIVKAINEKKTPLQNTALGGEIYIHGSGNLIDWTAGCIALTNKDMKELFDSIPVKTPITISP